MVAAVLLFLAVDQVFRFHHKLSNPTSRATAALPVIAVLVLVGCCGAAVVWFWPTFTRPIPARVLPPVDRVLLISLDTCRADHLNCYGYSRRTTPHIDAVARDGSLFTNVVSPTPMTLPSHSTMLTGTIPPYHGVHDNLMYGLGQDNVPLARILKDQGFSTGAVVGTFVLDAQFGLDRGFDTYDDRFENYDTAIKHTQRKGSEVSRLAIEWLENHQEGKFFLFAHYYDPHAPYDPPEPFASKFSDDLYAGEIAYTDHCVGMVLQKLKDLGLYDSTLVIITADHGELLGEHGEPSHSFFIYQNALRVPLVVKLPRSTGDDVALQGAADQQKEPCEINSVAGLVDIVPTVCGLMGIESPAAVRGIDLSGALLGAKLPPIPRQLYCESLTSTKYGANSLLGLVTDRWKYIQTTRPELYDLQNDPTEKQNLIDVEVDRALMLQDQLRKILDSQVRELKDNKIASDADARRKLESLGYVGGSVNEDLDFDQTMQDPKDAFKLHLDNARLMSLISEKKYDRAIRLCGNIFKEYPDYTMVHIHLAQIAMDQHDMARAVDHLNQSLAINPDDSDTHHYLGLVLVELGKRDEAIEHYQKAIALRPSAAAETHTALGLVLALQGKTDAAIHHHRQALRENPKLADGHNNLGSALSSQGKLAESITHLREALRFNPDHAEAHYNLGNALFQQGRRSDAVRLYRKALAVKPDLVEAHYNLAMVMSRQGQPDEAIHHYRQAIHFRPRFPAALNNLANVLASQGQVDEAIQYYEQAIELKSDYAFAHIGLAGALRVQGYLDRALAHFRKASRLMPDQLQVLKGMAWILATTPDDEVRQPEEAVQLAQRAAELTRQRDPEILDTLAAALAAVGRFDQAVKLAQAAHDLAKSAGNQQLAEQIRQRLDGYRQDRPYLDESGAS